MARAVHGLLHPQFLAVCCLLLLQVSECSRPSPSPPSPADHIDDALHHQLLMLDTEARTARPPTSTEVAGDGRTGADADAARAAPSFASATTPARAVGAVASSWPRQTSDRALLVRAGMLLRSKLARRILAGAGGVDEAGSATDGTALSCHSYNPHINCPPAWKP